MRCKGCNRKLNDTELNKKYRNPDGDWEWYDLCSRCFNASNQEFTLADKQYVQGTVEVPMEHLYS